MSGDAPSDGQPAPRAPTTTRGAISNAIARAISLELDQLRGVNHQAWLALSVVCALASLSVGLFIDRRMGFPGALTGAVLFTWFLGAEINRRRGKKSLFFASITFLIESLAPWGIFLAIMVGAGPIDAVSFALFGPLMLFGGVQLMVTLRLSPFLSLMNGIIAALCYATITLVVARNVAPDLVDHEAMRPARHLVRSGFFVAAGGLAALVAHGMRRAFAGAIRTVRAGDLFGKYRLERLLAKGGMGEVHLATYCPEGGFARPAAVKKIHAHLAKEQRFVDAFRAEAELGARLVHHHIVQVLDFGRVEDAYFLAMEYVDGLTLRQVMVRAIHHKVQIPGDIAVLIGDGVLAGLAFAHDEARDSDGKILRIVHRDLAPANVLISKAGVVKITDFGIARALRENASTITGVVGHSDHMAPEQVEGAAIDERADLFCAGIILWEIACGRALFTRPTDMASLYAIAAADVPLPSTVDRALAPWDKFMRRALAKKPDERYQSARDMAEGLSDVARDVGRATPDQLARFMAALPDIDGDAGSSPTLPVRAAIGVPSDAKTIVDPPR